MWRCCESLHHVRIGKRFRKKDTPKEDGLPRDVTHLEEQRRKRNDCRMDNGPLFGAHGTVWKNTQRWWLGCRGWRGGGWETTEEVNEEGHRYRRPLFRKERSKCSAFGILKNGAYLLTLAKISFSQYFLPNDPDSFRRFLPIFH